jgi:hypothetical protein
MKGALKSIFLCFGILAVLPSSGFGQDGNGVSTLNGGQNVTYDRTVRHLESSSAPSNKKLVKIYSNLGTGDNVYDGIAGYGILGPDAGQRWPENVACAFKPKANHTVTEIDLGLTHVQGTNIVIVSLNGTEKGVPGKPLHSWTFKNLPDFGTCCTLQVAKYAKGIPVQKGKLYWVVVRWSKKYADTYDVWNNDSNGESGTFTNDLGWGWFPKSYQQLGNFGVFGK